MDRSFLSDARVVQASRDYVCIRLATYEDKAEAEFMKSIYTGRSGALENTTFAILSPDGKRKLAAAGRGPFHAFRNSQNMAAGLTRIAAQYDQATEQARFSDNQLPVMKSLDLALNVAAAEGLPLIVTIGDDPQLASAQRALLPITWSEEFAGQFVYAAVSDSEELKPITEIDGQSQIAVVDPGQFGLSGKTLAQFKSTDESDRMAGQLRKIVQQFPRSTKTHQSHVRLGIELGIEWESEIPETDPQSIRARERARGKR